MRGGSPRASETIAVSAKQFEWDRCLLAVLRHSTMPWGGSPGAASVRAIPLKAAQLGRRDRLSVLAQFAAHQGMLRFAGIGDGELDPDEWAVIQKRGVDCRLIRVGARSTDPSLSPPALTTAQQFAELVGATPLDVFRQSWARAESVFIEAFRRLSDDAAFDLQWARASAAGSLIAPGADVLREILAASRAQLTYSDHDVVDALRALASIEAGVTVLFLGGQAIVRYGALQPLTTLGVDEIETLSEAEIVERTVRAIGMRRVVFVVDDAQTLDAASARVVQMLKTACDATWITPSKPGVLPGSRWYIVAPRIAAATQLEKQLATVGNPRAALDRFVASDSLDGFLDRGVVALGDARVASIAEPLRSYIAALSLLGDRVDRSTAKSLLGEFLCEQPLEDLIVDGVTEVVDDEFRFVSPVARRSATDLIPTASKAALCRVAASVCEASSDILGAARLLLDAGENKHAVELLGRHEWPDDAALIDACDCVVRQHLAEAPTLVARYARALVRAARYRDARDVAAIVSGDEQDFVFASVERRTGDYAAALARLERIPRTCERDLLRAEILGVERRDEEALQLLRGSKAENGDEQIQLMYALALAGDPDAVARENSTPVLRPHYAARLSTYQALDEGRIEAAIEFSEAAIAAATSVIERIDAMMDRAFALFSCGRWADARSAALAALAVVEETQGDRGAGGLLFLLAYLAADDGQWTYAAQRTTRLRHFYGTTNDARHLAELDLLAAHLDFSRGRFADAIRAASTLLHQPIDEPIKVAAALIVDEVSWITGGSDRRALDHEPSNAEFADRFRVNATRHDPQTPLPRGAFSRALALWHRDGRALPVPDSGSDKLKLLRAITGAVRRRPDAELRRIGESIAREFGVAFDAPPVTAESDGELRLLRAIATQPYPFASHAFDRAWRYAVRNRLAQWSELGSMPPLGREELDRIAERLPDDWIACSDRELLYIEGIGSWSIDARQAITAAFHIRAEAHRLLRLVDQDQSPVRPHAAVPGIVGDSPAIRDVIDRAALIARRDVAVCILGESGTGKELIAHAIHSGSSRRHKAFTPVNCSALPEQLIESELFGHVRGAFTGADRDRAGLIEASDGGTLFLDEIGEMPLVAQAKLLRFLQDGEFRRVGDTAARSADVRIVTATNRKLEVAVEEGRFREDLYYRIAAVEIVLPPLRERGNDTLMLASHFLALEHARDRSGPSRFSPEVEAILASYSWPGNVRELQNAVRGAHAVAGEAKEIAIEHLTERLRSVAVRRTVPGSYQDAVAGFRRELIERALDEAAGNQNRAAAMLKISRQALGYQIRELGILVGKRAHRTAL